MAGHRNQLQIILVGQLLIRFANRIETVKKRHPVPFLNDIADRLDQSERTFVAIHKSFSIHKEDRDMSEVKQPASALSSPRFCNMGTFMRMQKVDSAGGLDFAIAGAPFDTGSSFRSGSRFGPNAIRNISAMMKPNNVIMQVNIMESLKGGDIGDFNITPAMMRLKKSSPVFWKKMPVPSFPAVTMPSRAGSFGSFVSYTVIIVQSCYFNDFFLSTISYSIAGFHQRCLV